MRRKQNIILTLFFFWFRNKVNHTTSKYFLQHFDQLSNNLFVKQRRLRKQKPTLQHTMEMATNYTTVEQLHTKQHTITTNNRQSPQLIAHVGS